MRRQYLLRRQGGFTLIELTIVIVVIGLIAAIAIPSYFRFTRNSKAAATASELRSFSAAFAGYVAAYGDWPPDSHATLPPGMEEFLNPQLWIDETPIGGHYNWEGADTYGYVGISVLAPTEPQEVVELVDQLLDDGDLTRGRFRNGSNGRPTLIIQEAPAP